MPTYHTGTATERHVRDEAEVQRSNSSMKAVVNKALRIGLGTVGKPPRSGKFEVRPHAFGFRPSVDAERLNQLIDELEADEFIRSRGE
ncbi:MAG: hypothetical protein F4X31_03575 [Gammaproteobacteria bacterium]|nr:hypothetical protein [Gammaproteobacteria bacterium]